MASARRGHPALPAVLALLAAAACGRGDPQADVEFRVPVVAREVATGTVEDRIVATGTLRAPESAALTAETRGVLTVARGADGRRLAEGDRVRAGQTLVEITGDDPRLAARLEATEQRYRSAQQVLEARRRLFDEGLISEEELHNAETSLAEAKVEWERSQLTETRTRLVTPISGVVLRLARGADGSPVADGQLVAAGFEAARVAPLDSLIADVDLVGPDLARVRLGLPARVRHYAWEGEVFPGTLVRLSPAVDPVTRSARAEVEVANPSGRLRPGMFVEVTLVADRREGVPVVPREAVTERGGARVVFVVERQRVTQREVLLGLGDDEVVEVRRGIEPGDRIVVQGLETLTDGTGVRVSGD